MQHTTYLLRCSDGSLYCGYTNDLKKRVAEHNSSKNGARYTRSRRPVILVYSESFNTKSEALKRESEIKKMSKKHKEMLISSKIP